MGTLLSNLSDSYDRLFVHTIKLLPLLSTNKQHKIQSYVTILYDKPSDENIQRISSNDKFWISVDHFATSLEPLC